MELASKHVVSPKSHGHHVPPPQGTWFAQAYGARYRSEKEVDIRFVLPLLHHLGYEEADRADGFWLPINLGSKVTRVQIDFVCFAGQDPNPSNCLLLVETKSPGTPLHCGLNQARSYAQFMKPLRLLLTNGDEIEIWRCNSSTEDICMFKCTKYDLYKRFDELAAVVGRSALIVEKNVELSAGSGGGR